LFTATSTNTPRTSRVGQKGYSCSVRSTSGIYTMDSLCRERSARGIRSIRAFLQWRHVSLCHGDSTVKTNHQEAFSHRTGSNSTPSKVLQCDLWSRQCWLKVNFAILCRAKITQQYRVTKPRYATLEKQGRGDSLGRSAAPPVPLGSDQFRRSTDENRRRMSLRVRKCRARACLLPILN